MGSLPDVMPLAFRRTGTDDAIAAAVTGPAVTESSQTPRASTRPDAPGGDEKNPTSLGNRGLSSERDGTRTRNHRIDSPGENGRNAQESGDSAAVCATAAPTDPDLVTLVEAWPVLPADVRKMIMGVVRLTPKAR